MFLVIKIKKTSNLCIQNILWKEIWIWFEHEKQEKHEEKWSKTRKKKNMTFVIAFKVTVVYILMFQFQTWHVLEALVRVFATFFFFAWADVTLLSCNDWSNEYSQAKVELKLLRYPEMSIMVRIYYLTLLMWCYNFEQRNLAWVKFD